MSDSVLSGHAEVDGVTVTTYREKDGTVVVSLVPGRLHHGHDIEVRVSGGMVYRGPGYVAGGPDPSVEREHAWEDGVDHWPAFDEQGSAKRYGED